MDAISRRKLFAGIGLALAAPAIVSAANIMRVRSPVPFLWGDGIHDDTAALQALIDQVPDGGMFHMPQGTFFTPSCLNIPANLALDGSNSVIFKADGGLFMKYREIPREVLVANFTTYDYPPTQKLRDYHWTAKRGS